MKKLIQIALIVILVSVLFQAVVAGPMASTGKSDSNVASHAQLTGTTNTADHYAVSCLVRIKGVICVRPNVGWNT